MSDNNTEADRQRHAEQQLREQGFVEQPDGTWLREPRRDNPTSQGDSE